MLFVPIVQIHSLDNLKVNDWASLLERSSFSSRVILLDTVNIIGLTILVAGKIRRWTLSIHVGLSSKTETCKKWRTTYPFPLEFDYLHGIFGFTLAATG